MSVELMITMQQDEEKRKHSREFVVYEEITWVPEDPVINKCVKEILDEIKWEPDDIKVRATMILR